MNVWTSQLVLAAGANVIGLDAVWDVLGASWYRALLAAGLLVFGCCAGWGISECESLTLVRLVRWWIGRVLWPLLSSRSWLARAATIYANNMVILCGLVALGRWSWAVIGGTALAGVVMGVAMRTLSGMPELSSSNASSVALLGSRRAWWGMALNMWEPPAIAMALGVALSSEPESFSAAQTWGTLLVVVAPMMLVAAGGESLWMGESSAWGGEARKNATTHDRDAERPDESHSD